MASRRMRYWRFSASETMVAFHDPTQVSPDSAVNQGDAYAAGPQLKVEVFANPDPLEGNQRTIAVSNPFTGEQALLLAHGDARWLACRLLEAAALDEASNWLKYSVEGLVSSLRESDSDAPVDCAHPGHDDGKRPIERGPEPAGDEG